MSVTVTYDNSIGRVQVTATGLGIAPTAHVERSTNLIRWTTVRGGGAVPVTAGAFNNFLDDYEFPVVGLPVTYRVTSDVLIVDSFTRTESNGWGTASTGQTWTSTGTAAHFSVNGSAGLHSKTVAGEGMNSTLSGLITGDMDATVTVALSDVSHYSEAGLWRWLDANNSYRVVLVANGGNWTLVLQKTVGGVSTALSTIADSGLAESTSPVKIRFQIVGPTIRAKMWPAGAGEPVVWLVSAVDSSLTSGQLMFSSYDLGTGVVTTWDNLAIRTADVLIQTATITPTLDAVWLKSIARPFLNRAVDTRFVSSIAVSRKARGGIFPIVGRSVPVAVSSVRGSREWTMYVRTETAADLANTDLLLASGDILLVQSPPDTGVETGYVAVGDITRQAHPLRPLSWLFTLPMTEVAPPPPEVVGSVGTWLTVLSRYATWADLFADPDNATWADLLTIVGDPTELIVP